MRCPRLSAAAQSINAFKEPTNGVYKQPLEAGLVEFTEVRHHNQYHTYLST